MADDRTAFMIEMLRRLRTDMSEMRVEQREQSGRLGAIERSLAHIERDGAEHRAETGGWFCRILDRLERIERRLDLAAA